MPTDRTPTSDEPTDVEQLLGRVETIEELNDDDLATLRDELHAAAVQAVTDATNDAELEFADRIEAALNSVVEAQTARAEEATRIAEQRAERLARLEGPEGEEDDGGDPATAETEAGPEDDDQEDDGGEKVTEHIETETDRETETEPEVELEPEKIAASAPVVSRVAARRPSIVKPRPKQSEPELVLRASANVANVAAGEILDTDEKIHMVFERALRATGAGYQGPPTNVPLMSVGAWDPSEIYGEARTLGRDSRQNEQRIQAVTGERALRATGGICAPLQVDYSLPYIGSDARPVRDAFARFGADRGGARFLAPPVLADVSGATGVWTEANDVNPTAPTTKSCKTLDCPDEDEVRVAAIYTCLEIGNMRNMFFPEQIRAWAGLALVDAARIAENRLLQKLGDESVQIDVNAELLGTTRSVLPTLDRARASLTQFHRISDSTPLRMLAPSWLKHQIRADLTREAPGSSDERLATADGKIQSFFSSRNINVSWFMDGEAGQTFTAQGNGFLNGWPDTVVMYLYPEGSWLHLDGGTLDLGIVRDSTLNATNDFQIFSEFFEESMFHGTPGTSYRIEIDVCPTGEAAALGDTSALCTSGS